MPLAVPAILAVQCMVYALMMSRGGRDPDTLTGMLSAWGFIGFDRPLGLLTHHWINLGFFSLIINGFFLAAIGLVVEERLGSFGFLLLYLAGGAASGVAAWAFEGGLGSAESGSPVLPIHGPFGAAAAVTGAFLVFAPGSLIRMLVMFPVFAVYEIPASWFVAAAVVKDLWLAPSGVEQTLVGSGTGMVVGAAVSVLLVVCRIVPKQNFDLFHLIRQKRRLAEIRAASRSVTQRQTEKLRRAAGFVPDAIPTGEAAAARTELTERLAASDLDGIVGAFRRFVAATGAKPRPALNRRTHLDAANTLFGRGRRAEAAEVYARFLEDFPADAESPHVRLILAVIYTRDVERRTDALELLAGLEKTLTQADDQAILADLRLELNAGSAGEPGKGTDGTDTDQDLRDQGR